MEQVFEISRIETPFSRRSLTDAINDELIFEGRPQCLPCDFALAIP